MADPRFFTRAGPFTLNQLAKATGATLGPEAPGDLDVVDVMPLAMADEGHLTFIDNRKYLDAFRTTKASAVFAAPALEAQAPEGAALLLTEDPYRAFAVAATMFYPRPKVEPGIHPGAHVASGAEVAPTSRVEAAAVIQDGAVIGDNCLIGPGAVIESGVAIGADCIIGAGVTLQHCLVGDRVIIHPGVRAGQDGFGFAPGPDGHLKVPQLGRVVIESDVEIGANTTIDRGAGPDTVIGAGSKIDNLVQIAHNVRIGRGCIIVSQVGISGSTQIDDFVMIGGQAGLTGHLAIGKGARIAAQSGVMRDVPPGATIGGSPAKDMRDWLKESAALSRLVRKKGG
ncbi:MAG: UDP-3-O-(3-hydroxymyristoyl)glucosamine N-acyltransferase [Rhodospirillales bacterium CG15_BIG_FIL_POST_REV_8_21_14_020_66_15]|nr:MAG: UDP-3-O-(3-hydroxymyristoyl)glucosamine N-acyltransferase [Rhodospirillales bacterium CG15_BIG_FIL_POST_REV_8_21_14_020_66_15]